ARGRQSGRVSEGRPARGRRPTRAWNPDATRSTPAWSPDMSFARYPSLQDRTVFVTGGGSGIGASIVTAFAHNGARVAFVDIQAEASRALVAGLADVRHKPLFLPCDLVDIAALRAAMRQVREELGPIAVLVNNAANDERHEI